GGETFMSRGKSSTRCGRSAARGFTALVGGVGGVVVVGGGGGGVGGPGGWDSGAWDSVFRFGESPGPVALPLAGRRPSPRHRSLGRSYLLPKGSQRTSRLRGRAGIHRASVDQSQDLTRTLSDRSP